MANTNSPNEGSKQHFGDFRENLSSEMVVLEETELIVAPKSAFQALGAENGAGGQPIRDEGLKRISGIRPTDSANPDDSAPRRHGLLSEISKIKPDFNLIYPCATLTDSVWFFINVAPVEDKPGYVGVSHTNSSDYNKAEQQLHLANREIEEQVVQRARELEHFLAVSLDMHCIANPNGYFLRVNPAFTKALGWSEEELLAVPFVEFVHPDDREATTRETQSLLDVTVPQSFENRYRHKNGSWRDLSWNSVTGTSGLIYATARDVTEFREVMENLKLAKETAEKANLAKSEFLSRMSHELRTPMNAVLGYAQLLNLQHDDPVIKKATNAILKGGKHLLQLINEVLDLSRIESGNLGISLEPVSIHESLAEAMHLLEPVAQDAHVSIRLVRDCDGLYVEADRQRFLQVLLNILGNAIKYNHPGGRVEILCSQPSDQVHRIEISDTGPGIPPEAEQLLFQPFQRFGDPGVDGSGLGLAVSQRFVKLMGGALGLAESSPRGSTFYIELNRDQPPTNSYDGPSPDQTDSSRTLIGSVLYIEDNLSNVDLVETVLLDWENIKLVSVPKGHMGLDYASKNPVDLILLDVHLPDLMGDQVLERLKSTAATKDIPVVMLSADATRRQINASLELGAVEYLTKPLDISRLYEVLTRYLTPR